MEKEQFEYYFKEYHSLVLRVAFTETKSRADAEDILQEVFLKLLRYRPKFENAEHEKAWIIRATVNLCKDFLKSKWNNSTVGIDEISESEKPYFKVPYLEQDETLWAVLELKERYRQTLYLFYYEDYSIKEIARTLGLPENTVKTNLKRGREAVKKILERKKVEVEGKDDSKRNYRKNFL
ncbi:MAG: sigma-70 family RNA polymerase sigma factor [Lachnospiraceae bacterium]|nr:sigma-70 family RNA polymerase sigma factor [Lachnospiraceae bacterium]